MSNESITIQLFGDISFNGHFNDPIYQNAVAKSLQKLDADLGRVDVRIANWEAPITSKNDFHPSKNPILVATESAASLIDNFPLDAVCLANNHIADCGEDGVLTTMGFLDAAEIRHFGAALKNKPELHIQEVKGCRIGYLAFVGSETNPQIPTDSNIRVNYIDDQLIDKVSDAVKQVDVLIVNLHWGIEFLKYPSKRQIDLAHQIIDNGADIILGHHPHRLQGSETYKDRAILYSMGNFIFGGLKGKEHIGWPSFSNCSGVYELKISRIGELISKRFIPLNIKGLETILDSNIERGIRRQIKLDDYVLIGSNGDGLKRKLHILSVWAVNMPLFFIRSRGGIIGALRSVRWAHITMLKTYFFKNIKS
jgi:poly-gamma-glutamate capsule biosynthesis protein CapA/YwtB (metallophosphatase superfamily)